jgi:hypothetical protein
MAGSAKSLPAMDQWSGCILTMRSNTGGVRGVKIAPNVTDEHPWLAHNASATLDLDVPVRSRRLNVHNWADPSLRRARKSIARRGICSSRSHLRPDGVSSRRISRSGGAIFFGGDPPGCRSPRMDGGYARHATRRRNGCRLTSVRRSDRVFIHVVAAGIRRLAIGVRIVMAPPPCRRRATS